MTCVDSHPTKKPVQDDQQKKMHEMRMSGKKIWDDGIKRGQG